MSDEYVLVPKSQVKEDAKAVKSLAPTSSSTSSVTDSKSLSTSLRSSGVKGTVRTRLSQIWRPSTTSSSAFANSTLATLSTVPGAADFALVYDEYKIDRLVCTVFFDNATLAQANTLGMTVLSYDVNTSATFTLTDALRAQHRELLEMAEAHSQKLVVNSPKCRATASEEHLPSWQPLSQIANHTWGRYILGSNYAPSASMSMNIVIDYYVSFRTRI